MPDLYSAPLNWIVYKVLSKPDEILILGPYLLDAWF